MIIFLVVIIIILLIIGVVWWCFIRNKGDNTALLNSYLRSEINDSPQLEINNSGNSDNSDNSGNSDNYPGNIDNAISEINNNIIQYPNEQLINLTNGHPELMTWENKNKNTNANNLTNISAPLANGSSIKYQESNDNSIDYDEKNTYQLLKRNDPIRPIVGEIHRKSFVDPYLREELETTSKKEWWGNGEY